jgi:hypothetical protein
VGFLTERQLASTSKRIRALREELRVLNEQRSQFVDDADDMAIRALVSDDRNDGREAIDSRRHADAMTRRRADIVAEIAALEVRQDELLDKLGGG